MVYFDYEKFAEFIKYLRYKHKMSRGELAEKMGVSVETIKRYESGNRKVNLEIMIKLMNIFKISFLSFSQYFKEDET